MRRLESGSPVVVINLDTTVEAPGRVGRYERLEKRECAQECGGGSRLVVRDVRDRKEEKVDLFIDKHEVEHTCN